jgi:hypothetical protein
VTYVQKTTHPLACSRINGGAVSILYGTCTLQVSIIIIIMSMSYSQTQQVIIFSTFPNNLPWIIAGQTRCLGVFQSKERLCKTPNLKKAHKVSALSF